MRKFFQLALFFIFLGNLGISAYGKDTTFLISKVKEREGLKEFIQQYYNEMQLEDKGLSFELFYKGVMGFLNMKGEGLAKKDVVTIIDFSKPSTEKRLWIIDLGNKKILEHSLVAHGKNSGEKFAVKFSNTPNSLMSSLGFYLTSEVYTGKHGKSLRMEGMDKSNSNARSRAIVLHGADYVSEEFIKCNGRLGRSWGCPAVPTSKTNSIIDTIKEGSVLLISQKEKEVSSKFLDESLAHKFLSLLPW